LLPAAETERVRQLVEHGNAKFAVETAKQLHKQYASPDSESLLMEAYVARIRGLIGQGLIVEAKAMLEMVRERFPSARPRLEELTLALAVRGGRLDELLRPLNDPALPVDQRASIENFIRQQLYDLMALARCEALPETHPLRTGAMALAEALQAVTSGPVDEETLALPGISHRSPLAPWKMLVRAIASWYRGDDTAAKRWTQAIMPDTAPARLVPTLQKLLGEAPAAKLTSRAASLVAEVGSGREALRPALVEHPVQFAESFGAAMSLLSGEGRSACQAISSDIKFRGTPGTGKAGVDWASCRADLDACPHSAPSRRGAR
jgi:hypothetical protein